MDSLLKAAHGGLVRGLEAVERVRAGLAGLQQRVAGAESREEEAKVEHRTAL